MRNCLLVPLAGITALLFSAGIAPAAGNGNGNGAAREITPVQILPVDGPDNFQPSGLAVVDGTLYSVSDKHGDAIYRLDLEAGRATAAVARAIVREPMEKLWMDFEGLVPDGAGGFYVISEEQARVLHVPATGPARWVTSDLRPAGREVGILVQKNAIFEGLTLLGPNHFLLAAERNPRGLMEADLTGPAPRITATVFDESRFPLQPGRPTDFTDLAVWRGRVFALVRNSDVVCELVRDPSSPAGWREGDAVSFTSLERDPRTTYTDATYALAEGMTLDDTRLWVILDNNGDSLAADPRDRRARLIVFDNPFAGPARP